MSNSLGILKLSSHIFLISVAVSLSIKDDLSPFTIPFGVLGDLVLYLEAALLRGREAIRFRSPPRVDKI